MEDGVGSGGITYGGEVVQNATPGDDPTRGIEIPFEDENFLVKATSKNPPSIFERVTETLGNVGKGAYSWPFDYTLCIHWIAGYAGLYGPTVQRTCEYHKDRILSLIEASFRVVYCLVFRGVLLKIMGNETTRSLISDSVDAKGRAALAREIADRLPELQDGILPDDGRLAASSRAGWISA